MTPIYPGYEKTAGPSYSTLIYHKPTNSRLLFDLGLRKNWQTHLSPNLFKALKPYGFEVKCEKDVADILLENGLSPDDIQTVIFSHHHWDHVGDTTRFPTSTSLLVGPGYKKKYLPGWPVDPQAADTTSDLYEGRDTLELDFSPHDSKTCQIGEYQAYDWFGDGSFYILNSPGHSTGHLSALARTTASSDSGRGGGDQEEATFIFLGGDIAHHCAVFRPTEHYPLPDHISPAPNDNPRTAPVTSTCPGELFAALHHARNEPDGESKSRTTPFCWVAGLDEDPVEAQRSVDKMLPFDSDENVLTIFAHDDTLIDVIDFFPQSANDWKAKGWGKLGHWRFLAPLLTHGEV